MSFIIGDESNCPSDSCISVSDAFYQLEDSSLAGQMVEIDFSSSSFALGAVHGDSATTRRLAGMASGVMPHVTLNNLTLASKIIIRGDNAIFQGEASSPASVFTIMRGAPPVIFQGLQFVGSAVAPAITADGEVSVVDCLFQGNQGSALHIRGGTATVISSQFVSNGAPSVSHGGAIRVTNDVGRPKVLISDSKFVANSAAYGGAIAVTGALVTVEYSTFEGNIAKYDGGALHTLDADIRLGNKTQFLANAARQGRTSMVQSGLFAYILPAPLGTWLPNVVSCTLARIPCNFVANASCDPSSQPVSDTQPCEAEFRDQALTNLARGPLNDDFPFPCAPGLLGASHVIEDQDGPDCSGICPPGFFCPLGSTEPQVCGRGMFCSQGSPAPTPCRDGSFGENKSLGSQDECFDCPAGSFCSGGQRIQCAVGTYNALPSMATSLDCTLCPLHSTTRKGGAQNISECVCNPGFARILSPNGDVTCECLAGFGIDTTQQVLRCDECRLGTFKPTVGNTGCTTCALDHSTTATLASTTEDACACGRIQRRAQYPSSKLRPLNRFHSGPLVFAGVCDVGFYFTIENGTRRCKACGKASLSGNRATTCNVSGVTLERIPVAHGFYRQRSASEFIRPCLAPDLCRGGDDATDAQCAHGHSGPYCSVCRPNFTFSEASQVCVLCREQGVSGLLIIIGIAVGLSLLAALYQSRFRVGAIECLETLWEDGPAWLEERLRELLHCLFVPIKRLLSMRLFGGSEDMRRESQSRYAESIASRSCHAESISLPPSPPVTPIRRTSGDPSPIRCVFHNALGHGSSVPSNAAPPLVASSSQEPNSSLRPADVAVASPTIRSILSGQLRVPSCSCQLSGRRRTISSASPQDGDVFHRSQGATINAQPHGKPSLLSYFQSRSFLGNPELSPSASSVHSSSAKPPASPSSTPELVTSRASARWDAPTVAAGVSPPPSSGIVSFLQSRSPRNRSLPGFAASSGVSPSLQPIDVEDQSRTQTATCSVSGRLRELSCFRARSNRRSTISSASAQDGYGRRRTISGASAQDGGVACSKSETSVTQAPAGWGASPPAPSGIFSSLQGKNSRGRRPQSASVSVSSLPPLEHSASEMRPAALSCSADEFERVRLSMVRRCGEDWDRPVVTRTSQACSCSCADLGSPTSISGARQDWPDLVGDRQSNASSADVPPARKSSVEGSGCGHNILTEPIIQAASNPRTGEQSRGSPMKRLRALKLTRAIRVKGESSVAPAKASSSQARVRKGGIIRIRSNTALKRRANKLNFLVNGFRRIGVKLRILVSLYQILSDFGLVFAIPYPPIYNQVLAWFASITKLSFAPELECIMSIDYRHTLIMTTALPTILIGLLVTIMIASDRWIRSRAQESSPGRGGSALSKLASVPEDGRSSSIRPALDHGGQMRDAEKASEPKKNLAGALPELCANAAFIVIFLVYPNVSRVIFSYFVCDTWDESGEDGSSVLRVDMSLNCQSPEYQALYPYAVVQMIIYPIGVPVFFAVVLFRHRRQLHQLRSLELICFAESQRRDLRTQLQNRVRGATESVILTQVANRARQESLLLPGKSVEDEVVEDANQQIAAATVELEKLSEKLPPIIQRLTAGYEMRCFAFEVFEWCAEGGN